MPVLMVLIRTVRPVVVVMVSIGGSFPSVDVAQCTTVGIMVQPLAGN